MPGPLPRREADIVAGTHGKATAADARGERAIEDVDMLLLEQVVMRRRGLHAGRQLLDRDADMVVLADRGPRQMPPAQAEARHVGPFGPRDIVRRDRPRRRKLLCRHVRHLPEQ